MDPSLIPYRYKYTHYLHLYINDILYVKSWGLFYDLYNDKNKATVAIFKDNFGHMSQNYTEFQNASWIFFSRKIGRRKIAHVNTLPSVYSTLPTNTLILNILIAYKSL